MPRARYFERERAEYKFEWEEWTMDTAYRYKQLTEQQRKDYVARGGVSCPFCPDGAVEGHDMEFGGGGRIEQLISCSECGEQWWDVYQLVDAASDESEVQS